MSDKDVEVDESEVDFSEDYVMDDLTSRTGFEEEEVTLGDFRNATRDLPDDTVLMIQPNPEESDDVVPVTLATTSFVLGENEKTGYFTNVGKDEMPHEEVKLAEETWDEMKRQKRALVFQPATIPPF